MKFAEKTTSLDFGYKIDTLLLAVLFSAAGALFFYWFPVHKLFLLFFVLFFFNDPATTEIYTLSLHDALPILSPGNTSTLSGTALSAASPIPVACPVPFCSFWIATRTPAGSDAATASA